MMRTGLLTLALLLLGATSALAAPGSGSSGFGGGGGGFSGGGGGSSGGGSGDGDPRVVGVIFGLALIFVVVSIIVARIKLRRMRARRRERVRRVELAAAEAAADHEDFAPHAVAGAAGELCHALFRAWSARDRDALRARLGPDLMVEWERRLDDFESKGWHNLCEVLDGPRVEYVGLVNREGEAEDRVTVRIEARINDFVRDSNGNTITRTGASSQTTTLAEYWTLGRRDGEWILVSIEQDAEGAHHLDAPIVASPWSDETRLHDEALTELATADAVPDHQVAEVADLDFDGTARAAALDLALVDGRFAPDVLEAAARRAVAAWAEAVDGDDAALERAATPQAARELLYGGDEVGRTRLVVRGPRLRALRIADLHADATPPAMAVEADVSGRRYREDRDTAAVVDGSKDREVTFTERWTMALDGDAEMPWRIAVTGAAAPS